MLIRALIYRIITDDKVFGAWAPDKISAYRPAIDLVLGSLAN